MDSPQPSARDAWQLAPLPSRYAAVRAQTRALTAPLSAEDCLLQSMPDASPVKWHLAHTSWFFETFVLARAMPERASFDDSFRVLFNSYYVGVGPRHPRPERGLLSRPPLERVFEYRAAVDQAVLEGLAGGNWPAELLDLVELGIQHEQQHQELILTDIKHHLWCNPLHPPYRRDARVNQTTTPQRWIGFEGGMVRIGHPGGGFCFDNERPLHRAFLEPFEIAGRLVTSAEYQAFMSDGGYHRPELWLSDGWDQRQREGWRAPLYWVEGDGGWRIYTLDGERPPFPDEPVCHVSYYEADAYARWAGARLATELEWESVAKQHATHNSAGTFLESGGLHPRPSAQKSELDQMFGDAWEWTQSAYLPYPGYQPATGAVGEYNGKFMVNQMVLRGGSCATPASHIRPSYRNFFPAGARWQFSGIRLARSTGR